MRGRGTLSGCSVVTISILIRQQQCGGGSVWFGDGPELLAGGSGVAAQQAKTILQAKFILGDVSRTQLAPVAMHMPRKKFRGVLLRGLHRFQCAGSCNDLAQWKCCCSIVYTLGFTFLHVCSSTLRHNSGSDFTPSMDSSRSQRTIMGW